MVCSEDVVVDSGVFAGMCLCVHWSSSLTAGCVHWMRLLIVWYVHWNGLCVPQMCLFTMKCVHWEFVYSGVCSLKCVCVFI